MYRFRLIVPKEEEEITPKFKEELEKVAIGYEHDPAENVFNFKTTTDIKRAMEIKHDIVCPPVEEEKIEEVKEDTESELTENEIIYQILNEVEDEVKKMFEGDDKEPMIEKIAAENVEVIKPKRRYIRKMPVKLKKPEERAKVMTFKERLDNDPEYKQQQLDYLSGLVKCPVCGVTICRGAVSKHRRSKRHLEKVEAHNDKAIIANIGKMLELLLVERARN